MKIKVTGLNAKLLDAIPLEHRTLKDQGVNVLEKRNMTSMLEDESNKEPACNAGDNRRRCRGREYPLEKGMATHSSVLAWEIPWTEEPGGLQSFGLQKELDMS